ncbi:MAG: cyclic nucleotide-binding domain-containing protein [Sphingomonadales bacterium]|jgi:CRP-like cAMP-binding protein
MHDLAVAEQWLAGLPAAVAAELAGLMRPFQAPAGAVLFRQDDAGDGLWLLAEGQVRVESRTPGDGVVVLSRLGAGAALGEMALLDGGNRSAAAVCETDASGLRLDAAGFAALKAARRPAALAVQARLQAEMAGRVVALLASLAGGGASAAPPAPPPPPPERPLPEPASQLASFPGFMGWQAGDWAALLAQAQPFAAPRGALLVPAGSVPGLFIMARGAVRLLAGAEQFLVLGPGSLAGLGHAMIGAALPVDLLAAENCHGWWLAADALATELAAATPLALGLRDLADRQLPGDLRRLGRVQGRRAAMLAETEAR